MPRKNNPDNRKTSLTVSKSTRQALLEVTHGLIPAGQTMTIDERILALIQDYKEVLHDSV